MFDSSASSTTWPEIYCIDCARSILASAQASARARCYCRAAKFTVWSLFNGQLPYSFVLNFRGVDIFHFIDFHCRRGRIFL